MEKGVRLVFLTALISGISIFINSYAVQGVSSTLYTLIKNVVAAVFIAALVGVTWSWKEFKGLDTKTWLRLGVIGTLGGGIAFILFFKGLQMSTAVSGSFIHKTMFVWIALMSLFYLKEKISIKYLLSAGAIMAGLAIALRPEILSWNSGATLILVATLLWAIENVISKQVLSSSKLSGKSVALARMFIGSVFILGYLAATSSLGELVAVSSQTMIWALVTGAFLFIYQVTWYSGLKTVPVYKAAAILSLGAAVTPVLMLVFKGAAFSPYEGLGFLLVAVGSVVIAFLEKKESPTPVSS